MKVRRPFVAVSIIPTGIRCSIGGYIGDATLATNMLAAECDYLITNPNAVNGGAFNFKEKNVLYVEGYAIDNLFRDRLSLRAGRKNRMGVVIERMPDMIGNRYAQKAIEAFSAVAGVEIAGITYIEPLKKSSSVQHGQVIWDVEGIDRVLQAARKLRDNKQANAIAIATHLPVKKTLIEQYQRGLIPNPYGQLEALLSHATIQELGIPAAHAPLLTKKEMDFFLYHSFDSDPRASLENICPSYLGSILIGLSNAPQFASPSHGDITLADIRALIVPSNCLRSIPVAEALERHIPVIEVTENKTIHSPLPLKTAGVIRTASYKSACSLLKQMLSKERRGDRVDTAYSP